MSDAARKTAILEAQWPKTHTHSAGFVPPGTVQITPADWKRLPFKYTYTDAYCTSEARDCECGSTLLVLVEIHDLSEE